jgi:hypothetical protein
MVTFGKQHVRGGWIRYVPKKTLYKRRDVSQKPWLPVLADIVATSPCGSMTFLETAQGQTVHRGRLRQLVLRPLRRGRIAAMLGARAQEGWRHLGGGERRHRFAAHGNVRLVDHQPS